MIPLIGGTRKLSIPLGAGNDAEPTGGRGSGEVLAGQIRGLTSGLPRVMAGLARRAADHRTESV